MKYKKHQKHHKNFVCTNRNKSYKFHKNKKTKLDLEE